jgi:hypothetical protein
MKLRKSFLWVRSLLVLMVLSVGTSAWMVGAAWRQETLDAALIAALKRSDPEAVRMALARGADPSTCVDENMDVSLWGFLKHHWNGVTANTGCPPMPTLRYSVVTTLYRWSGRDRREEDKAGDFVQIIEMLSEAKRRNHP